MQSMTAPKVEDRMEIDDAKELLIKVLLFKLYPELSQSHDVSSAWYDWEEQCTKSGLSPNQDAYKSMTNDSDWESVFKTAMVWPSVHMHHIDPKSVGG